MDLKNITKKEQMILPLLNLDVKQNYLLNSTRIESCEF